MASGKDYERLGRDYTAIIFRDIPPTVENQRKQHMNMKCKQLFRVVVI